MIRALLASGAVRTVEGGRLILPTVLSVEKMREVDAAIRFALDLP